jgi:hypothetical protein
MTITSTPARAAPAVRFMNRFRARPSPAVHTRRIHEQHLRIVAGLDTQHLVPGGLGLARGDRQLLPEQMVEQRGLAHIGPSDERDIATARLAARFMRSRGLKRPAPRPAPLPGDCCPRPRRFARRVTHACRHGETAGMIFSARPSQQVVGSGRVSCRACSHSCSRVFGSFLRSLELAPAARRCCRKSARLPRGRPRARSRTMAPIMASSVSASMERRCRPPPLRSRRRDAALSPRSSSRASVRQRAALDQGNAQATELPSSASGKRWYRASLIT